MDDCFLQLPMQMTATCNTSKVLKGDVGFISAEGEDVYKMLL